MKKKEAFQKHHTTTKNTEKDNYTNKIFQKKI